MLPANRTPFPLAANWNGTTNRLESFFDRFLGDEGWPVPASAAVVAPVSFWQDDDHYYAEVDLPGVAESDIDLIVHDDLLTIRCQRNPDEGRKYLYNARTFGRIERTVRLPGAIDSDAVQASISHGVLRLAMPKSADSKPKKITVRPA